MLWNLCIASLACRNNNCCKKESTCMKCCKKKAEEYCKARCCDEDDECSKYDPCRRPSYRPHGCGGYRPRPPYYRPMPYYSENY